MPIAKNSPRARPTSRTNACRLALLASVSMLLALAGVVVAPAAFAHANQITAQSTCQADGTWTVTWTVANDYNSPSEVITSNKTSVVPVGTTFAKNGDATYQQDFSETGITGATTLTLGSRWNDGTTAAPIYWPSATTTLPSTLTHTPSGTCTPTPTPSLTVNKAWTGTNGAQSVTLAALLTSANAGTLGVSVGGSAINPAPAWGATTSNLTVGAQVVVTEGTVSQPPSNLWSTGYTCSLVTTNYPTFSDNNFDLVAGAKTVTVTNAVQCTQAPTPTPTAPAPAVVPPPAGPTPEPTPATPVGSPAAVPATSVGSPAAVPATPVGSPPAVPATPVPAVPPVTTNVPQPGTVPEGGRPEPKAPKLPGIPTVPESVPAGDGSSVPGGGVTPTALLLIMLAAVAAASSTVALMRTQAREHRSG